LHCFVSRSFEKSKAVAVKNSESVDSDNHCASVAKLNLCLPAVKPFLHDTYFRTFKKISSAVLISSSWYNWRIVLLLNAVPQCLACQMRPVSTVCCPHTHTQMAVIIMKMLLLHRTVREQVATHIMML
jgi:hypothetical protein